MCMSVQNEVSLTTLIDAMNVELEAGNWANVVLLSTELYAVCGGGWGDDAGGTGARFALDCQ